MQLTGRDVAMKRIQDDYLLAPTDLANHLACRHLTALSQSVADGELTSLKEHSPIAALLSERGRQHELEYLAHLRSRGCEVVLVDREGNGATAATLDLMRRGTPAIAQAALAHGRWHGRVDVLLRVDLASGLGSWSYEAVDTKLARQTKGGTILQLCAYSLLLEQAQGLLPEWMYVVSPGRSFEPESHRLTDFSAYFRRIRDHFESEIGVPASSRDTYPRPTPHCDVCVWWRECQTRRRADDHLSLVAFLGRLHEAELETWGITTRTALANLALPITQKPDRGSLEVYERLREQARLQVESPPEGPPRYELRSLEEARGLARLPEPSPGDVFLDIEGDPFAGEHGHEYLFGYVTADEPGRLQYDEYWALEPGAERSAFERLIDDLMARWQRWPDFHIYHFAPYEPSALKRLMGRYASRQDEMDELLRGLRFIDLYQVVRQGMVIGVESYSIKNLEPLYRFERGVDLREASKALLRAEIALERGVPEEIAEDDRQRVLGYNRDDCLSTLHLRSWLESVRSQALAAGENIPRPPLADHEPSEKLSEHQARTRQVMEHLHEGLPDDPETWTAEHRARWILGHLLEWHRRESKSVWWDFFRLADLPEDDRFEEPKAIAGMSFEREIPQFGKRGQTILPAYRYTFPPQEVDQRAEEVRIDTETVLGTVMRLDATDNFIEIKKRKDTQDLRPSSVFMFTKINDGVLQDSLLRLGQWVADHQIDAPGPYRAARDLLLRLQPRLAGNSDGPLQAEGETTLQAARRLALELDGGFLSIQGPPGTGKTYTAARMIVGLVQAGKKVGITALSHKVIRNLLDKVVEAAAEEGIHLQCVQKISSKDEPSSEPGSIEETKDRNRVQAMLAAGEAQVAAGTAWLWAREELAGTVDVLFVDEAGQMSLANTLAASQAGRSLVLVGDPQQLEQPIQGTHPDGTGVAALEHVLSGADTISKDQGLFLETTRRLHPKICEFTSDLYYDGLLTHLPELAQQGFHAAPPFDQAGLYFLPVEHQGNQSRCTEEVDSIKALVESWLQAGAQWTDETGARQPLGWEDILIVAPYNQQVFGLKDHLPGEARIGTVDKFQGQEAPVVIYSMTSSSPEDAPRGMEFLYNRHRFNVATSRARCAVVLVASPRLLEVECRTPRQMTLANGLCAFVERARCVQA